jgi:hypothetical protein
LKEVIMNTALNRRLTHSLALLAVLAAGHLQAENGSERVPQQTREHHSGAAVKLAENGSERSIERQRQLRSKQALHIAEGGAERSQALRRA